jgi:signal transduction histidine kinase
MQQLGDVCSKLRRWPRRITHDLSTLARECLDSSCDVFSAPRGLLVIDEGDEPWLNVATLDGDEFTWKEDEDISLESVVVDELADRVFQIEGETIDDTIDSRIRPSLGSGPLLSIPIVSDSLQGRLFVCEPGLESAIAFAVADAVGALIAVKFEATAQVQASVREALEQERTRVARDLHDGLLQSFTGVVLQLETVHSTLIADPQTAQQMITEMQGLIMSDQRELRRFVEQLRPRQGRRESKFDFAARLDDLRNRFAKQWGIQIAYDVDAIDPAISGFVGQETYRLIHEAVTNSAKHGRASLVRVLVRTEGSEMQIEVADNGSGFPFHGRLTLEEMMSDGVAGPIVLAERVASLNGSLTVDSTESGATVRMTVPLGFGA